MRAPKGIGVCPHFYNWQNMIHEVIHQKDFYFLGDIPMLLALSKDYKQIDWQGDSKQISKLTKDKCNK
jgi:hypothetical protein